MSVGKSFSRLINRSRSVIAIAAIAAAAQVSSAALIDVTQVLTGTGTGTASSTIAPGGDSSSYFKTNTNYTINFAGGSAPITGIIAGGNTYNIVAPADTITVRKNQNNKNAADVSAIYYQGSITGSTINLKGTRQNSLSDALKQNDVYVGVDNLFANKSGGNGNNVRSERLDVVFSDGIASAANKVFGVFDRGNKSGANSHDPFKIAAITNVDANGNPTSYGNVIAVERGWGQASVLGSAISTAVLRNSKSNSSLTSPSAFIVQPVGGILISTDELAGGTGVTIYGYSLFAYDVTGTGNQLLDWTNESYFPKNTKHGNGGLDLLSITGLIETSLCAVPEPAMMSVIGLGALGLMRRKRRSTLA